MIPDVIFQAATSGIVTNFRPLVCKITLYGIAKFKRPGVGVEPEKFGDHAGS